jgi:hypothetical protein
MLGAGGAARVSFFDRRMKCEHCGYAFDTIALKAKQGTETVCPSCGKMTRVHYSFADSFKDFHGVLVRDPKYVGRPLTIIFFVLVGIVLLITVSVILRQQ